MDILRLPNELLDSIWNFVGQEPHGMRDLSCLSRTSHAFHDAIGDRLLLEGGSLDYPRTPLDWAIDHDRIDVTGRALALEPFGYKVILQHLISAIIRRRKYISLMLLLIRSIRWQIRAHDPIAIQAKRKPHRVSNPRHASLSADPLVVACRSGMVEVVEALLGVEGFLYSVAESASGTTPLVAAAQQGHVEICSLLLSRGFHPGKAWNSILCSRSRSSGEEQGRVECLRLFLDHGMDPSDRVLDAIVGEHVDSLKVLLEHGAKIDAVNPTASVAYRQADAGVAQLLIEYGADVNLRCGPRNRTPLHGASEAVARLLIRHGADVNAVDGNGQSPILTAFDLSHVSLLVDNGAELDIIDNNGNSLLHCLLKQAHEKYDEQDTMVHEVLRYLLGKGLGHMVNKANNVGSTPLHMALHRWTGMDDIWPAAHVLLEHGADINARDARGMTPLMSFYEESTWESNGIDEAFFTYRPDLNASTPDGRTTLIIALEAQRPNHSYTSQQLLEKGANVNGYGSDEKIRALHFAAYRGNIDHVEKLIWYGASVDARDARGHTPLMVASWARHSTNMARRRWQMIITCLLDHGADADAKDDHGRTAADYRSQELSRRAEAMPEFSEFIRSWGDHVRVF